MLIASSRVHHVFRIIPITFEEVTAFHVVEKIEINRTNKHTDALHLSKGLFKFGLLFTFFTFFLYKLYICN